MRKYVCSGVSCLTFIFNSSNPIMKTQHANNWFESNLRDICRSMAYICIFSHITCIFWHIKNRFFWFTFIDSHVLAKLLTYLRIISKCAFTHISYCIFLHIRCILTGILDWIFGHTVAWHIFAYVLLVHIYCIFLNCIGCMIIFDNSWKNEDQDKSFKATIAVITAHAPRQLMWPSAGPWPC